MSIPGLLLISALATAAPEPSADVEVESWRKLGDPVPVRWAVGRDEVDRFRVWGGEGPRRFVLVAPDGTQTVRELVGLTDRFSPYVAWSEDDVAVVVEQPTIAREGEYPRWTRHLIRVGRCVVGESCRWFYLRVPVNRDSPARPNRIWGWIPLPLSEDATLILGARRAFEVDLHTGLASLRRDWHPGPLWPAASVAVGEGGGWVLFSPERHPPHVVVSFDGRTFRKLEPSDGEVPGHNLLGPPEAIPVGRPQASSPALEARLLVVGALDVEGVRDLASREIAIFSYSAASAAFVVAPEVAVGTVEGRVVLWRDGALWTLGPPPEVALQQGQVLELKRWCDVDEAPLPDHGIGVHRIGRDPSGRWWVEYDKGGDGQDLVIHTLRTSGCASSPP